MSELNEQLLDIARRTGLRAFLHGVNATDARELLGAFVAELDKERATSAPQAAPSGPVCPACKGSGEGMMMEGSGPDAYEVPCACPHCKGAGTLAEAYWGVVALLDAEREKYLACCGKLYFATPAPAQKAEGDARDAVYGDAVELLKRLKRDLMHARLHEADTRQTYARACTSAEGDIEDFFKTHKAAIAAVAAIASATTSTEGR